MSRQPSLFPYSRTQWIDLDEEIDTFSEPVTIDDDEEEVPIPEPGQTDFSNPNVHLTGNSENLSISNDYLAIREAKTYFGAKIKPGSDVELLDGDFLRVFQIMKHTTTSKTFIRGQLFRRCTYTNQRLRKAANEVCALLSAVDPTDKNPPLHSYSVDVPLDNVLSERTIILTNRLFGGYYGQSRKYKDLSFRDYHQPVEEAEDRGVLVCRWKYIEYGDEAGRAGKHGAILQLHEAEADTGKGIPDAAKVYWWRETDHNAEPRVFHPGATIDFTEEDPKGGIKKQRDQNGDEEEFDKEFMTVKMKKTTKVKDKRSGSWICRTRNQSVTDTFSSSRNAQNTFRSCNKDEADKSPEELCSEERTHADFCSGCGGAASGAEQAGSKIKFLLDKEADECKTLRLAFPQAHVHHMMIDDFVYKALTNETKIYKVVTAHISYPCKTYSGIHTREGKEDEQNEDTSCSVDQILKICRPKVVTFEQTSHMVRWTKNKYKWNRLLFDITWNNYSVKWKVLDATDYGCPSTRERLIILAAWSASHLLTPGHPVPDFPLPCPGPKTTVWDALVRKPRDCDIEPHMLQGCEISKKGNRSILDKPHPYTITCSGGDGNYHPIEDRGYDVQELALLMGFAPQRKFAPAKKTALLRQLGNAVPPGLMRYVQTEMHKSLDQGEVEMAMWLAEACTTDGEGTRRHMRQPQVIEMDEDEDLVLIVDSPKKKTKVEILIDGDDDVVMENDSKEVIVLD